MTNETQQVAQTISPYITYLAPIVTLLIGATIGFLFSILKDKINEDRKKEKEKKELALKRLEELFINISTMNVFAFKTFSDLLSDKQNDDENNRLSNKTSFFIRSFFPNIKNEYDEYLSLNVKFRQIQINRYMKKASGEALTADENSDFETTSKLFAEKVKNLLSTIISETKKYD